MEILDEFDSEVPQSETFCQQISEEDLERQVDTTLSARCAASSTASTATRRWRRGWCNWNSVGSSLFSGRSVVQGELNHCNSTGALEMLERVKQLKQSIHRMHPYSRGEDQPLPVLGPAGGLSPMQPGRGLDDHLHSFGWICPPWTKFYPEQEGAWAIPTWEERRCP
nr:uncharacterized protein LOC107130998 isoform X1 [Macaca fascicularis]